MSKDAIDNNLRQVIRDLTRRISALERQQNDVGQLSELSSDMGLQLAGEFRAGNGVEPGDGFSGVRMTADGVSGYDNDVLQSSMSATDGKITAGAGEVTLGSSGLVLINGTSQNNRITWVNEDPAEVFYLQSNDVFSVTNGDVTAKAPDTGTVTDANLQISAIGQGKSFTQPRILLSSPASGAQEIKINSLSYDVDTIIYSDTGAVLTVDAGDNDVDIATKMNFGDTGAITGGSETINDDAAFSFTPATARGVLIFRASGANTTTFGMFTYAAIAGTAYCYAWTGAGSAMVASTGAKTGTTGTDGKVTVSAHTDGKIYIENRSGGNLNCAWQIVAGV